MKTATEVMKFFKDLKRGDNYEAFTEIAIPHRDIIEGNFKMETYASDLWEVAKGEAPEEYRDREIFLSRTYETNGLKQIVSETEKKAQRSAIRLGHSTCDTVWWWKNPYSYLPLS